MDAALLASLQEKFAHNGPKDLPGIAALLQTAILTVSGLLARPRDALEPAQAVAIRHVLEMGAYWSVHARDGASFERYLSQLTNLYDLPVSLALPASPHMFVLVGLRLLNLLVTNRRADFYTSLARLDADAVRCEPHLQFVVQLEQCLMEGTYHRLLVARSQVPAPEYVWFVDSLLETIRIDLANGIEKAFPSLDIDGAARMLLLDHTQIPQLLDFAAKRGWTATDGRILFPAHHDVRSAARGTNPKAMIGRALFYASQLEQIV